MRSKATGTLPSLGCASVLFALALILLAPAAYSTDHTDCATASQEDFAKAFQLCKPLAEQGDADAQHKVGWMYSNAKGVPQDYAEALKWYQLAAEQGWGRSQLNLGLMYDNGQGVAQDYVEGVRWYRMAAEQGFAGAQYNLGRSYFTGQGVAQDYEEAVEWFRAAADQGHAPAQGILGVVYYNGHGVPQDYEQAVQWYRAAAEQGLAPAQNSLAAAYRDGEGVAQDYGEAVRWFRAAAEQGLAIAQVNLGAMYREGQGVAQDYEEAAEWFRAAAEQGLVQAKPATGSWVLEDAEELVSAIEAAERGEEPPTDLPQDLDGALREAAEGLNRYLDEHPDDVSALILSARLQRLQDLSEAVVWSPSAGEQPPKRSLDAAHQRLNRALILDSDNAEAHYWHARLYGIREPVVVDDVLWKRPRNLDKAIEHAQRAVELAPARSEYREALGLYLYAADRYQEAVTVTRKLADGRHLMHRLLTDMEALELPESATYSPTKTQKFISFQESRGRYAGIAYAPLRVRVYIMPGTASELERFLARRWPDVSLFRMSREKFEGMTISQYAQFFHWREDGMDPTAKKNQIPEIGANGLALNVVEIKNPTHEFLETFDLKPVDVFCQIYLMNSR